MWRPENWGKSFSSLEVEYAKNKLLAEGLALFEAGADAIEPFVRKNERDRLLKFLKGLGKANPKASLLATLDLIEATKPPDEEIK